MRGVIAARRRARRETTLVSLGPLKRHVMELTVPFYLEDLELD
jgi:hypothetical protein